MLGSIGILPGTDFTTGAILLTVFLAGAGLAVIGVFAVFAFRRAGESGAPGKMWRAGLVAVGVVLGWALLDRSMIRDQIAERRAIETRASELTSRAIAPGSALACLDAVAGPAVEAACEKSLFASPEAIAAAVAYMDARVSLLSASIAVAERDASYRPAVERLRRGIEADRFGLVSHVMMTRGCAGTDCPDLKLVRDSSRITSNMRSRTFDAHVSIHALAWNPSGVAVSAPSAGASASAGAPQIVIQQPPMAMNQPSAITPQPAQQAPAFAAVPPATMGAAGVNDRTIGSGVIAPAAAPAQGRPKLDFPSSASIPAVSIMTPEPGVPQAAEPKPAPKRPAQAQAPRPQPAPRPAAPPQMAPSTSPPQTSGAR